MTFISPDVLDYPAIRAITWRVSAQKYQQLSESGVIPENTELIRGVVVDKMTVSPKHSWVVRRLTKAVNRQIGNEFEIRQEQPLAALDDSMPEPDIAVVIDDGTEHQLSHPSTAELIIEVCVSSESVDRQKISCYAQASVAECWLVLVERSEIEVFTSPSKSGYTESRTFTLNETVASARCPSLSVKVADFIPASSGPTL